MSRKIQIVEVGPRDGLQNEAVALSVAQTTILASSQRVAFSRSQPLWFSTRPMRERPA